MVKIVLIRDDMKVVEYYRGLLLVLMTMIQGIQNLVVGSEVRLLLQAVADHEILMYPSDLGGMRVSEVESRAHLSLSSEPQYYLDSKCNLTSSNTKHCFRIGVFEIASRWKY